MFPWGFGGTEPRGRGQVVAGVGEDRDVKRLGEEHVALGPSGEGDLQRRRRRKRDFLD